MMIVTEKGVVSVDQKTNVSKGFIASPSLNIILAVVILLFFFWLLHSFGFLNDMADAIHNALSRPL